MKRAPELSLILPCFNESGLFADSVSRIRTVLDEARLPYEVIFVDDASRDNTAGLISRYCAKRPAFRYILHTKNTGRGRSVADGIRAAKGRIAGYIDIDCEVDPVYIPTLVRRILNNEADVAIGKRFYRTTPGSVIREILSRGYQWLSDVMIGTGGMDTETGYKFFDRKKILPVLKKTKHSGWFWDTEIMVRAKRAELRIIEEPVLFLRRFDKQSSVNIIQDTADYLLHLYIFRKTLNS